MIQPTLRNLAVGDEISPFTSPALTRWTLALYAGASGDHHPMHIDSDFAKEAGMGDVFGHGMLSMAYLGKALTNWAPQTALREFSARFVAITHLGDELTCGGTVTDIFQHEGETRVRLALTARNQQGDVKLIGEAVLAMPEVQQS